MYYEPMPLYPSMRPSCDQDTCVKVPMFEDDRCDPPRPMLECRRVTIENPCRPGERAEVILGVDACGNLMVCVQRDPRRDCDKRPCRGHRREPGRLPDVKCDCRRGRLYGSWEG